MEEPKPETSENSAVPPAPPAEVPAQPPTEEATAVAAEPPKDELDTIAADTNGQDQNPTTETAPTPAVEPAATPSADSETPAESPAETASISPDNQASKLKFKLKKPAVKIKDPLHVILIVVLIIISFIAITSFAQANSLNKAKKDLTKKVDGLQKQVDSLEAPTKYTEQQLKTGQIQAVFLSTGQVYFGNIIHLDSQTITLQNIYYLKDGTLQKNGAVSGSAAVIKLSNSTLAPEDKMVIERKNVTLWVNLQADSKVSQAIVQYKATH